MERTSEAPGAGPSHARIYCPDCRLVVETETGTCPRCPPAPRPFAAGVCPRCRGALRAEELGSAGASRCPACRGLFFERGTVALALDLRLGVRGAPPKLLQVRARLARFDVPARHPGHHPPCARCAEPMARRRLGVHSAVTVEACPKHGLWFDAGMFERFAAYVEAGGLDMIPAELERERAEAEADERSRRIDERISKRRASDTGGLGLYW